MTPEEIDIESKLKVKDIMTTDMVTISKSTPLYQIIKLLREYNYHTLPVIDEDNTLLGLVTIDDILNIFQPYNSSLGQLLKANPLLDYTTEPEELLSIDISNDLGVLVVANDIMSAQVHQVNPELKLIDAYARMNLEKTDKVLVTENKKLIGMLTLFDLILALFKKKGVV
jgi:CBS domain-containing protein